MFHRARIAMVIALIASVAGGQWPLLVHHAMCHSHSGTEHTAVDNTGVNGESAAPQVCCGSTAHGHDTSVAGHCHERGVSLLGTSISENADQHADSHSCAVCYSLSQLSTKTKDQPRFDGWLSLSRISVFDGEDSIIGVSIRQCGRSPPHTFAV